MKKNNAIVIIMLILISMGYGIHTVFADVIIQNGSTLTINSATLDMNCNDIIVADGATLDLGSGLIDELGELAVDPGGTFLEGSGTVILCPVSNQGMDVADPDSNLFDEERSSGTGMGCFIHAMGDE